MKKCVVFAGLWLCLSVFSMVDIQSLRSIAEEYFQYGPVYWEQVFLRKNPDRLNKIYPFIKNIYDTVNAILSVKIGTFSGNKEKVKKIFELAESKIKQTGQSKQNFYMGSQKKETVTLRQEQVVDKKEEILVESVEQAIEKEFGVIQDEDIPWFTAAVCFNAIKAARGITIDNIQQKLGEQFFAHNAQFLFAKTVLFRVFFEMFLYDVVVQSKISVETKETYLNMIKSLANIVNQFVETNQNILIPYVQNAFSFFGTHPDINQDNLDLLRPIFEAVDWISAETKRQKLRRLTEIEEKKYIFGIPVLSYNVPIEEKPKRQEPVVNKELSAYLQEHSEKPIISIGTEHLTEEQWNNHFHTDMILESYDIEYHKMPGDQITHQKEYVINLDADRNPDLQGNINDQNVRNYLLKEGEGKIYLIWEEGLDSHVMAGDSVKADFVDLVYSLLRDGGYFVFGSFKNSPAPNIQKLYAPFLQLIKEKFGKASVSEYVFDQDVYRVKKALLKEHAISEIPKGEQLQWDYSKIPEFPIAITVPVVTLQPHKNVSDLPNYVQSDITKGKYTFNEKERIVYEEVTINFDQVIDFDKRTRIISQIDPILAKYSQKIIVAQKMPKEEKIIGGKQKEPTRWEKIKQYVTKQNILRAIKIISLPLILYGILRTYRKNKK